MQAIRTLADLIHAVTNSLSLISSHSQYMLGKRSLGSEEARGLQVIYEEAERAASLLSLVPRGVARSPIHDSDPPEPRTAGPLQGTGGPVSEKGGR